MPALAGANLIYGLGMLEMAMTMSYPQLVMDAEFAEMIKYSIPGIPINDESLSVEVIDSVGYAKDFLSHKNTFIHRKIQSQPKLMDRRNRTRWLEAGGKSLAERAEMKAREILMNHRPEALPEEVLARLEAIVQDAEAERRT